MVDLDLLIQLGTKPCPTCGEDVVPTFFEKFTAGSCVKLKMECHNCQQFRSSWVSQKQVGKSRFYEGNVLTACGILFGGQSAERTCGIISLKTISDASFYEIQKDFLIPAIHQKYSEESSRLIVNRLGSNKLIISGDGRFCSPGEFSLLVLQKQLFRDLLTKT